MLWHSSCRTSLMASCKLLIRDTKIPEPRNVPEILSCRRPSRSINALRDTRRYASRPISAVYRGPSVKSIPFKMNEAPHRGPQFWISDFPFLSGTRDCGLSRVFPLVRERPWGYIRSFKDDTCLRTLHMSQLPSGTLLPPCFCPACPQVESHPE
jgi:hypothetical protein